MTSRPRRAVVTGLGAVSAWGWGRERLWQGLQSGRAAIGPFDRFDSSGHRTHIASQVPAPSRPVRGFARLSLADRYAVAAAEEACRQAGLPRRLDALAAGVFFGGSTAGMWESEGFLAALIGSRKGPLRLSALASQQINGPADEVARRLRIAGPVESYSSACASAAYAFGAALDAIRSGEVDVALVGGADALCELTYAGFNALRAVSPAPCSPFREGREGLTLGEGGAVVVLESDASCRARGARPLAELRGAGFSCDAHHMTAPQPQGEGAARAIRAALADGDLAPDSIDAINAHGTGTPLNDAAEWHAVTTVFGERAERMPLTSTKGCVGHWLGSSGSVEAVATCLCIEARTLHPTPGAGQVDPELAVRLVRDAPLPIPGVAHVLSTSFGFGGANGALIFGRPGGDDG